MQRKMFAFQPRRDDGGEVRREIAEPAALVARERRLDREVDVPRPMTRVQVLWQTGAVSDFTIERKDRA
jgi:hypothetical protein